MIPKPKITKSIFKILTGVVIGSAIGSILGLTLAPKEGAETRKVIKDKSMEIFLRAKDGLKTEKRIGFLRRLLGRWFSKDE
jgi:gas vesicle protein